MLDGRNGSTSMETTLSTGSPRLIALGLVGRGVHLLLHLLPVLRLQPLLAVIRSKLRQRLLIIDHISQPLAGDALVALPDIIISVIRPPVQPLQIRKIFIPIVIKFFIYYYK